MKKKLTSVLLRNLPYKILALVLACAFWGIVQGEEILEVNRRVIVNIKVPNGYAIKGAETRIKDATMRGSRALLSTFLSDYNTKPIEAVIPIPEGKVGQLRFRVDKEYIRNWDNRIRLTVHDPYINVFVDVKDSKKVPVREFLKGVPADGYIIEKSIVKPNAVLITGLKSEIAAVEEVLTEPIDVENLSQTKSFEAKLVAKDLPKAGISVEKVTVNLMVGEKKVNKRFGSVPVEVVGSDFVTAVKPRFVSIVIQGTPGVLSFVSRTDLEAFVEARDLEAGQKHVRSVQVKIPPDTVLIETFPPTATVEVYSQKKPN